MARHTGPVCRLCRREGQKLNLKGERCNSPKCAYSKRSYPPGHRGPRQTRRSKESTYGLQLRAKQATKRTYGVLERQFRRYFAIADRTPGITGTVLLQILEQRLDNIVYRLGFGPSRAAARLMISHGHVLVDGKRVDRPSYQLKPGQAVGLSSKMIDKAHVASALDYAQTIGRVEWLEWDAEAKQGKILTVPERAQIPTAVNEQLIVELFSK